MDDTKICSKCGKEISWDEYVNNWGWCDHCLTEDYTEYLMKHRGEKQEEKVVTKERALLNYLKEKYS